MSEFQKEINDFVLAHPQWKLNGQVLCGQYDLRGFAAVQKVVQVCMELAEQSDHHPTVTFGYSSVVVQLTTHDAGNTVSQKDLEYAQALVSRVGETG